MTAFDGFPSETIRFLGELRANNHKEWKVLGSILRITPALAATPVPTRTTSTSGSGRANGAAP